MSNLSDLGVLVPDILLPDGVDASKWACIACDQYTSQPDVWAQTEKIVGAAPSTLRIVLPELWLNESDVRIPRIHETMRRYAQDVLTRTVHGCILTARTTESGCRKGLVLAVDLEQYDYMPGSASRIRATEGTILSRIPARMKVRQGALLETPHIMLLINDPQRTLIEPLYEKLHASQSVYDTDLQQNCGHLTGWALTSEDALQHIADALTSLDQTRGDAPLFAVGDGNHSLASAKATWDALKPSLTPEQAAVHPARYALCEVVNLYDDALVFAPIHRVLCNVDADALALELTAAQTPANAPVALVTSQGEQIYHGLPINALQPLLDAFMARHAEASLDYVHGDDAARALGQRPGCCALLLITLDKLTLFPAIAQGPLPRKAFSMGEAHEKRCYFECRLIG